MSDSSQFKMLDYRILRFRIPFNISANGFHPESRRKISKISIQTKVSKQDDKGMTFLPATNQRASEEVTKKQEVPREKMRKA